MDKKTLSEADICEKFITPAIQQAGWNTVEQIYREYTLRPGRVVVRGNYAARDKKSVLRADYVLFYKANIPLVVVEAKDNSYAVGAGMAQAINYAALLNIPFAISSNGGGFIFRDATLADGVLETQLALDQFPTPSDLWERYCVWKGWPADVRQVAEYPYAPSKTPRYYQMNAINGTVQAIAKGQQRILLVMATGTGKTYTAFQIIYRLWKSTWRSDKPSGQKRILFLADRNILIDQTMVNDFRPFKGAMAKLSPNAKGVERVDAATGKHFVEQLDVAVNKSTKLVDKSYEIYLSLYQAVSGTEARERVQYLNAQGKLITESLRDYTRINLTAQYNSLDQFLQAWNQADRKAVLLQELEGHGVLIDALALEVGKDLDPFDMLIYVAWNMPPLTRRERANRVKKRNVFTSYGPVARQVLDALIDKYADQGIRTIESDDILTVPPLNTLGSPVELVRSFGGRPQFLSAIKLLETELYSHRAA